MNVCNRMMVWARLALVCGALVLPFVCAWGAAAQDGASKPDTGLTIDSNGMLTRVDRTRSYGELRLDGVKSLRTDDDEEVKYLDQDGKEQEKDVFLFQDIRVRRLVFPAGGPTELDTKSLTGIRDLEEIVFEGDIPSVKTEYRWFTFGEDDWRRQLKQITLHADPEVRKLDFAGEITCIRLMPDAAGRLVARLKEQDSYFRGCAELKRIVVPYVLARNREIRFAQLFRGSGLQGREVVSEPDPQTGAVILLNVRENGEISEGVTHLRSEAVAAFDGEKIILPTTVRGVIGERLTNFGKRYFLKDHTVRFSPEIDNPERNKTAQDGSSAQAGNRMAGQPLFTTFSQRAQLSVSTAYERLRVRPRSRKEPGRALRQWGDQDKEGGISRNGLAYQQSLYFEMGHRYDIRLELLLDLDSLDGPDAVPVRWASGIAKTAEDGEISFATPEHRCWVFKALLIVILGALVLPLLLWIGNRTLRDCSAIRRFTDAYLKAPWWAHVLFFASVVVFALGWVGVLGELMDVCVWQPVAMYLNASFISSLVISLSTTGLQILLGVVKGISIKPMGFGVDFAETLAPITDMLARLEWVSWLSTLVLMMMRMLSDVLRMYGTALWTLLGAVTLVWAFPGHERIRSWRPLRVALCALGTAALGVPFVLWGASWLSGQMSGIAGVGLDAAMANFTTLAENFSLRALLSLEALKTLVAQLLDACSALMTASFSYMAVKAFDCFAVPLLLLWLVCRVLKSFGYEKADFKALMERLRRWESGKCSKAAGPITVAPAEASQPIAQPSAERLASAEPKMELPSAQPVRETVAAIRPVENEASESQA